MYKHYIKEEAFEKLFIYLNGKQGIYCKNRQKTRKFLEAVYFIMRTGAQWLELSPLYGNYKTVHKRFLAWAKKGIWNEILSYCSKDYDGWIYSKGSCLCQWVSKEPTRRTSFRS